MAEDTTKKRSLRKTQTVRERAEKASSDSAAPRRLSGTKGKVAKPFRAAARVGRKEYHPITLPDNRLGRLLNRRARLLPRFFAEAWAELREVSWPGRKETTKLTIAVFIFAIVFGLLIALLDFGLDKLFRGVILN